MGFLATSCIYPKLGNTISESDNLIYTANNSFLRDSYQDFIVDDTLVFEKEEDLSGLPGTSFLQYSDKLLFTTRNGYLYISELNNIAKFTKKKLTIGIDATPTISDSILFIPVSKGNDGLIAYDMVNGSIVWELPGMFSQSSPLIFKNNVIHATLDGSIYALDIQTSETKWTIHLEDNIRNSLALVGNNLILATQNGLIRNYNAEKGTIKWSRKIEASVYATPVTDGNSIFIATYAGEIFKINMLSGDITSSVKKNEPIYLSPALDQDHLYVPLANGTLVKLDKSNLQTVWSANLQAPYSAGLLLSKNSIIAGTTLRGLFLVEKNTGNIIQRINLNGRLRTQATFYNDKIYISHESSMLQSYHFGEINE